MAATNFRVIDAPEPVVKWAGGKRKLIPFITSVFPKRYLDYYEPFLGGGAIAFSLPLSKRKYLGDLNQDLITFYQILRDRPEELFLGLQETVKFANQTDYDRIRVLDRSPDWRSQSTEVDQAVRFLFLNKCCFNGLWRVNKRGQNNVPFNKKKIGTLKYDFASLVKVSQFLNCYATLCHTNYLQTCAKAKEGDLIYLDPPYDPLEGKAEVKYNAESFDQEKLAKDVQTLVNRGCYVLLSNSDTPRIRQLYQQYEVRSLSARRSISANGDRTDAKEVLVIASLNQGFQLPQENLSQS